ncbi:MAG: RDD family protein [Alcanivoracaceae bacterium]|nr:RDD family protein [Alcanivoracaceae bacterium]
MIDERQNLLTPEGAELNLTLAGPVPRSAAFIIDMAIRCVVYAIVGILMIFFSTIGQGVMLILMFVLEWFYPVVYEVFRQGQTPGKRMMGLAVAHADGTPITLNGSLLRNLLRTADFFPFMYLAGFISMLSNARFQRLGDLVADSVVVHVEKPDLETVKATAPPRVPDWSVTLDDQRTLIAFLERGVKLSQPRRQELALLAYEELSPEMAEMHALGNARYLRGGDDA